MTKILQIFKIAVCFLIEQVMRIELTSSAWQADALTVVLYLQKFERVVGFEPTVIPDWKSGAIDHYATLARDRKLNFKSFGLLELNQF